MSRTLLVVPTAAGASLARTCLGLVRALDRRGVNVAFVKPVAQPRADGGPDRSRRLHRCSDVLPAGRMRRLGSTRPAPCPVRRLAPDRNTSGR